MTKKIGFNIYFKFISEDDQLYLFDKITFVMNINKLRDSVSFNDPSIAFNFLNRIVKQLETADRFMFMEEKELNAFLEFIKDIKDLKKHEKVRENEKQ